MSSQARNLGNFVDNIRSQQNVRDVKKCDLKWDFQYEDEFSVAFEK